MSVAREVVKILAMVVYPPLADRMTYVAYEADYRVLVNRSQLLRQLAHEVNKVRQGGYWQAKGKPIKRYAEVYGHVAPRQAFRWINR